MPKFLIWLCQFHRTQHTIVFNVIISESICQSTNSFWISTGPRGSSQPPAGGTAPPPGRYAAIAIWREIGASQSPPQPSIRKYGWGCHHKIRYPDGGMKVQSKGGAASPSTTTWHNTSLHRRPLLPSSPQVASQMLFLHSPAHFFDPLPICYRSHHSRFRPKRTRLTTSSAL